MYIFSDQEAKAFSTLDHPDRVLINSFPCFRDVKIALPQFDA